MSVNIRIFQSMLRHPTLLYQCPGCNVECEQRPSQSFYKIPNKTFHDGRESGR